MSRSALRRLSNDEVFKRWQDHIDLILTELMYLFENRQKFRELQQMFQDNKRLNEIGSQPYEWLLGHWGRDAVIAIRRELDSDRNTVSFGALLDEMAERNNVLTRKRFLGPLGEPGAEKFLVDTNNQTFDSWGVVSRTSNSLEDYLSSDGITADRILLNKAAAPVLKYANQLVAHRTPVGTLPMTVADIHTAFDAIEETFKKYFVIVTGRALVDILPSNVGDDWKDVFTFPWYERPKRK